MGERKGKINESGRKFNNESKSMLIKYLGRHNKLFWINRTKILFKQKKKRENGNENFFGSHKKQVYKSH